MGILAAMGGAGATIAEGSSAYTFADTVKWDAEYDVVVLGLGCQHDRRRHRRRPRGRKGAHRRKDERSAGGQQLPRWPVSCSPTAIKDREATMAYYTQLAGGRAVPESHARVIVDGVITCGINSRISSSTATIPSSWTGRACPIIGEMSPEYPEFEGSDKVALCTTHQGVSDSFLYKSVKNAVIKRADKIDVWFESPAVELIQDPDSRIVVGVKVTRNGETRNVRALGGVVVATGGFECDTDMAQQYLGLKNYSVIGGQFNTGDGIKMCQKVGADLWHMNVFEGGFGTNSCGYAAENGSLWRIRW